MTIGLMTQDFEAYYECVRLLREKNVPFYSLSAKGPAPAYISVVLTTEECVRNMRPERIVRIEGDVESAVERAINLDQGKPLYERLVIGIDPGKRPGICICGDGEILRTYHAHMLSKVTDFVRKTLDIYQYRSAVVRIGHGAPTQRNILINSLLDLGIEIEVVDETSTSEGKCAPDIQAAIHISGSRGKPISKRMPVRPSEGEVRDIQRISRIESKGELTISKALAIKVAKGQLGMPEAINVQKGVKKGFKK